MGFFSKLFGLNNDEDKTANNDAAALPEILSVQKQEEGFEDISLKITAVKKVNINYEFTANGRYENTIVGLKFALPNHIKAGINNNGEIENHAFLKNGLSISSIGQESDNFLKALSKIYKFPNSNIFSTKTIKATIFPLNKMEADFELPNYYKFKVFFNADDDNESYAEVFINFNLSQNFIEFNEKASDYRSSIIKALSAL